MANKITAPEMFDFKKPDEWQKWIRRFDRYRMACDLHKKVQVNTLLYAMGDAADDAMTTFMFGDEGDRLKYDKVKKTFDQYFLLGEMSFMSERNSTSEPKLTKLLRNSSRRFIVWPSIATLAP